VLRTSDKKTNHIDSINVSVAPSKDVSNIKTNAEDDSVIRASKQSLNQEAVKEHKEKVENEY
jgi:hypothetical protein